MSPHNLTFASGLDPVFFARLVLAYQVLPFQIAVGYRSGMTQEQMFAERKSRAHGGESAHQYGLAVDAVPFLAGDAGALNWNVASPAYGKFVANMKAHGLMWGGDWHSFKDDDHFQDARIPATPNAAMQGDFRNHATLAEIWRKVAAGAYA